MTTKITEPSTGGAVFDHGAAPPPPPAPAAMPAHDPPAAPPAYTCKEPAPTAPPSAAPISQLVCGIVMMGLSVAAFGILFLVVAWSPSFYAAQTPPEPVPSCALLSIFDHPHAPLDGRRFEYIEDVTTLYRGFREGPPMNEATPHEVCRALTANRNYVNFDADILAATEKGTENTVEVYRFAASAPAGFIVERTTGVVANALFVSRITKEDNTLTWRSDIMSTRAYEEARLAMPNAANMVLCVRRVRLWEWSARFAGSGRRPSAMTAERLRALNFTGSAVAS